MYANKVGLVLPVQDLILMRILIETCTRCDDEYPEGESRNSLQLQGVLHPTAGLSGRAAASRPAGVDGATVHLAHCNQVLDLKARSNESVRAP